MAVKGIGEVLAEKIIKGRPYGSESAVLEDRNLPPSLLELVKAHVPERKAG
jgi:DNA uptake protein ComE-like DNA-binding protein